MKAITSNVQEYHCLCYNKYVKICDHNAIILQHNLRTDGLASFDLPFLYKRYTYEDDVHDVPSYVRYQ